MPTSTPAPLNPSLSRDVAQILVAGGKLHAFSQGLARSGALLPAYLYLRPLQAEIVFTRPAVPRLTQLFGRDGWRREPAGASYFDWVKRLDEGVTLRVSECEEVASPQSEVPPAILEAISSADPSPDRAWLPPA